MGRNGTPAVQRVLTALLVFAVVFGFTTAASAQYAAWHYSANIDVNAGTVARTDGVAELAVNFTTLLADSGGSGKTLDVNSIRVVEYTSAARTAIAGERASQFDTDADFQAQTRASGELVWLMNGATAAGTTRYFTVFYDVTENGSMTAPSYSTGLSWNPGTRVIDTPGYRATYSATLGSVRKLESKLQGSPEVMWDADETAYPRMGHWYTINEDGAGWIDSFGGPSVSVDTVKAGPVRVTITSRRDEGRVTWTTVRKFYAGNPPAPYWKAALKAEKNDGAGGRGIVWLKRTVWNTINAPQSRTLTPIIPAFQYDPFEKVFDYGADGGVGIASSGNYYFNSSEVFEAGAAHQGQFETWGETWRMPHYPIVLQHPFVIHSGTDEPSATAAMDAAWNDYNSPLKINLAARATLSGVVTDSSTAQPIRGAVVRVKSGFNWFTTQASAKGEFSISNLPTGGVTVSAKADRYTYFSQNVTLVAGANAVNPALNPAPYIDLRSTTQGGSATWLLAYDIQTGGPVNPPNDDFSAPAASEAQFNPTEVPGDWDLQQGPTDNIYGWYRTHVTVPANWAGSNLRLRNFRADDVDETFFNGVKIGQTGEFPPDGSPRAGSDDLIAYSAPRSYVVPSANVVAGGDNVIAIRIFDYLTGGGLITAAPILEVAPPSATVQGTVSGPGGPLAGATVTLAGVGTTVTNGSGVYTFTYVPGALYEISFSAFGHKSVSAVLEVPDTGSITKNQLLEASGSVSGIVSLNGVPKPNVRVVWTGAASGTDLTDANGQYSFSAAAGDYSIVFNVLGAIPKTENITVANVPYPLNVTLETGITPSYDMFPGTSLDMGKWQYGTMEPGDPPTDAIATVSNGVLKLESAPARGGLWSTANFGTVSTQELVFARPYVGVNQILDLYGGTGQFGTFVEFANEGSAFGLPRMAVFGTATNPATAVMSGTYPFAIAVVRTGSWFDFYINGQHVLADSSSGLTGQHRLYLYGYEATGETIGYYAAVAAGTPVAPTPLAVGQSRNAAVGAGVTVSQAVVTASFPDAFWIQKGDEPLGIKVLWSPATAADPNAANPAPGTLVNVAGRVIAVDAETALQAVAVNGGGAAAIPDPYNVIGRTLKWLNNSGASAQGLLVNAVGICTGVVYDEQSNPVGVYIDDGSGLQSDVQFRGVYVMLQPQWQQYGFVVPIEGQFVIAKGVVTVTTRTGAPAPAIRPQTWTDVVAF